jgi:hypothetical protein
MDAYDMDELLEMRFAIASTWSAGQGKERALRAIDDLLRAPPDEDLRDWNKASFRTDERG